MSELNVRTIPWVEKYRPTNFEQIVLDEMNQRIFRNILAKRHFPHLLFYGPPGTGKTTTIMNLIHAYQHTSPDGQDTSNTNQCLKGTVIHLNASDERGIDIIRNQIYKFVKSSHLFATHNQMKFVILDEVDYMTKNAQHALKYLLQTTSYNVRFCLICNYISKIEPTLLHEFICIRFNQLPRADIRRFVRRICDAENIKMEDGMLDTILDQMHTDIRSIVNFIQLQYSTDTLVPYIRVLTDVVWRNLYDIVSVETGSDAALKYIHEISLTYNVDKKSILMQFLNYVVREALVYDTNDASTSNVKKIRVELTTEFVAFVETMVHDAQQVVLDLWIEYFTVHFWKFVI
jgi:DNA polymerase III delta prime subunit